MAHFVPPTVQGTPFVGPDPETIIEYTIAIVFVLAIVFVEEIDIFVQRNVYLLTVLTFSLIFGAGVLYTENPPLAILAILLLVAIIAVQSRNKPHASLTAKTNPIEHRPS